MEKKQKKFSKLSDNMIKLATAEFNIKMAISLLQEMLKEVENARE